MSPVATEIILDMFPNTMSLFPGQYRFTKSSVMRADKELRALETVLYKEINCLKCSKLKVCDDIFEYLPHATRSDASDE